MALPPSPTALSPAPPCGGATVSPAPSRSCPPLRVSAAPPAAPKGAHKVPASWTSGQVGAAGAGGLCLAPSPGPEGEEPQARKAP